MRIQFDYFLWCRLLAGQLSQLGDFFWLLQHALLCALLLLTRFMCLSPCSLSLNLWKMCRSNIYTSLFYKQRWFEAFSIFSINISYKLVLKRIIYIAGGENFHVKAQQAIGLLVQVIHKKPMLPLSQSWNQFKNQTRNFATYLWVTLPFLQIILVRAN